MADKYDTSYVDELAKREPASAPLPVEQKYDTSFVDSLAEKQGVDKAAALFTASFGNQSEEVQKRKLAADIERITGNFAPVLDLAEATRQHRQLQADHATRASPRTSEFLSVPDNAKVALDDAKTMAQIAFP